jgi:nicotinamidase-related amidase
MDALLVIDVDGYDYWASDKSQLPDGQKQVAESLCRLLEEWRASGKLITFATLLPSLPDVITQVEANEEHRCIACDLPENLRLAKFLAHRHEKGSFEPVFVKIWCNAFNNKNLCKYLRSRGVTKLFLAGCMTDACVAETAMGAVKSGFDVTLVENCTYPKFSDFLDKEWWVKYVEGSRGRQPGTNVAVE